MKSRRMQTGFAMVPAILVVVTIVGLSLAIVSSSFAQHSHAVQATDRARTLALAEGAATLLLADLSDDALRPVRDTATYSLDGMSYARTYAPFDMGDGQARIEVTYSEDA